MHHTTEDVQIQLVAMLNAKRTSDAPEVQALVRKHYESITRFWTPDKERYIGLGEVYKESPDFKRFYDAYHPDLLDFLVAAMRVFAEREL
jgi:hypothetical protein